MNYFPGGDFGFSKKVEKYPALKHDSFIEIIRILFHEWYSFVFYSENRINEILILIFDELVFNAQ